MFDIIKGSSKDPKIVGAEYPSSDKPVDPLFDPIVGLPFDPIDLL
ncbi:hypothetical protein VTL71DRAFT_4271 [Oculimacula yallundae]|uniref:Uncharacterized protein n=1 Tax=Oculimacula yallundae TaxID=86028 RepID=A0ABR4C5B1_9HELO